MGRLAYIPEEDLHGVPVTGSRPVGRYVAGPHAGKIRLDSYETIMNAIGNQVENAARGLRAAPSPAFVYVIGFKNPSASDSVEPEADVCADSRMFLATISLSPWDARDKSPSASPTPEPTSNHRVLYTPFLPSQICTPVPLAPAQQRKDTAQSSRSPRRPTTQDSFSSCP